MKGCLFWIVMLILCVLNLYCIGFTIYTYVCSNKTAQVVDDYITDTSVLLDIIREDSLYNQTDYFLNCEESRDRLDSLLSE